MELETKARSNITPAKGLRGGGILQRKCACGQHTPGGAACSECAEKKKKLQTKLKLGAQNDPLEQEADRVADQIVNMPDARTGSEAGLLNANPLVQRRVVGSQTAGSSVPASVSQVLQSPGRPLDASVRSYMEPRFNYDFSGLRIHDNPRAAESSEEINAKAYTVGNNVVFNAGQYRPDTLGGRRLIAHELSHVIQQGGSGGQTTVYRDNKPGKKKSTGKKFKAKDVAEFKFEPPAKGEPCACLVFVHNNEKSARKIANLMHDHCRYNFASVQGTGRCIPMPGEPAKGSCKKGTIDPNELFPKKVAKKCIGDIPGCEKFVTDNAESTDPAIIKEVAQHQYFLTMSKCSKNFTLPVVALHNNDVNDTATYRSELKKKRPKAGSSKKKDIEKGKKLDATLKKLKVDIDKSSDSNPQSLKDMKETLKKEFKATDKGILFGQGGKTNIFRWCSSKDLVKCHIGDPERPDHVVWTTNENDFKELSKKPINAVLQEKPSPSAGKGKSKSKGGESDTDLSTLFLFIEQIVAEEIDALVSGVEKNIISELEQIIDILKTMEGLMKTEDLLPEDALLGLLKILFSILEILVDISIILGLIDAAAARTDALRYINIETPRTGVSTKNDPAKFDFILSVLEPLGLNCCDKAGETSVRTGLEPAKPKKKDTSTP